MRRRFLMVGLAMGLGFAPGMALAGDIGCVWRAIPEGARTAAVRAFNDNRPDDVYTFIDETMFGDAMSKCVARPNSDRGAAKLATAVASALSSYIIQVGSEQSLQKSLKIDATALDRAYNLLEPKKRRDLAVFAEREKTPSQAAGRALATAIRSAYPDGDYEALVKQPAFGDLVMYFAARSRREQNEARF